MKSRKRIGRAFVVLAVILSVAMAVCNLDHAGSMVSPMAPMPGHAGMESSGCIPDSCLTLTSKSPSSLDKAVGFVLLTALFLVSGPLGSLLGPPRMFHPLFASGHPPPYSPGKLYKLHGVFLL